MDSTDKAGVIIVTVVMVCLAVVFIVGILSPSNAEKCVQLCPSKVVSYKDGKCECYLEARDGG